MQFPSLKHNSSTPFPFSSSTLQSQSTPTQIHNDTAQHSSVNHTTLTATTPASPSNFPTFPLLASANRSSTPSSTHQHSFPSMHAQPTSLQFKGMSPTTTGTVPSLVAQSTPPTAGLPLQHSTAPQMPAAFPMPVTAASPSAFLAFPSASQLQSSGNITPIHPSILSSHHPVITQRQLSTSSQRSTSSHTLNEKLKSALRHKNPAVEFLLRSQALQQSPDAILTLSSERGSSLSHQHTRRPSNASITSVQSVEVDNLIAQWRHSAQQRRNKAKSLIQQIQQYIHNIQLNDEQAQRRYDELHNKVRQSLTAAG